jgi:hypothetical protein
VSPAISPGARHRLFAQKSNYQPVRPSVHPPPFNNIIYKNFLSQPLAWFYSYNLSHAIGAEMRKSPAHARTHRHSAAVGSHLFYCHPLGVNQNKVHWHTDARA